MLKLKVIVGSTRPGRAAERVILWIVGRAEAHSALDVELLDLKDWPLPFFAENFQTIGDPRDPTYFDPIVKRWNQRIASGDVYLFVTPEYNHSMPAVLKNAIDSVFASFGFRNKAAAFVSYSGGIAAGVRAIEHLAAVAVEAEMMPLRSAVIVPFVSTAFDEHGAPTNSAIEAAASIMLDDLEWWGVALQKARQERQLPPTTFRKPAAGRLINQFPPTSDTSSSSHSSTAFWRGGTSLISVSSRCADRSPIAGCSLIDGSSRPRGERRYVFMLSV